MEGRPGVCLEAEVCVTTAEKPAKMQLSCFSTGSGWRPKPAVRNRSPFQSSYPAESAMTQVFNTLFFFFIKTELLESPVAMNRMRQNHRQKSQLSHYLLLDLLFPSNP